MKITKQDKRSNLQEAIDSALSVMSELEPFSDEYSAIASNLEKLYRARDLENIRGISPDTIAIIAGNLFGIGLILGYERMNVITSKALGFVMRGRV